MVGDREKCLAAQMDVSCTIFMVLQLLTQSGLSLEAAETESIDPDHLALRYAWRQSLRPREATPHANA